MFQMKIKKVVLNSIKEVFGNFLLSEQEMARGRARKCIF